MKKGPKKGDYLTVNDFVPFRMTIRSLSNCKDNWENLISSMEGWKKPDELERSWLTTALNFIHLHWGEISAIHECISIIFSKRKKDKRIENSFSFSGNKKRMGRV